jgi:microcystin synthetase protein McyG
MNHKEKKTGKPSVAERLKGLSPEKRKLLLKRLGQKDASPVSAAPEPVAVIGMSCRFPGGADSPEMFWSLLNEKRDGISETAEARWRLSLLDKVQLSAEDRQLLRWGGFVDEIDQFDPTFFDISPREATTMDPQQRLAMEVAWEALESAGQALPALNGGDTGIFFGLHSESSDYYWIQLGAPGELDTHAATGGAHSITANRLSYFLDLRGPSMVVDTACSSSLVAVHLACQSLRSRECEMALAGGVNLILSPENSYAFSKLQFLSPDGRCKTFDAGANGYVRGEGCGVVVLRRLSDAMKDGDPILALIRGSAVNQDGASNGLTAPSGLSQQAVVKRALKNANVSPDKIGFVETHGTGTPLGDPIEVESLSAVLGGTAGNETPCRLGAVKSNIGHLEAAAGIAGLIKIVLCMQHRRIPANLHFNELNPNISLKGTRLEIPVTGQEWTGKDGERFAGVSSFGFGGTNAHVILQDPPEPDAAKSHVSDLGNDEDDDSSRVWLLPLSARSDESLGMMADRWREFLSGNQTPPSSLDDICYTAAVRRTHHHRRLAVVGANRDELIERIEKGLKERLVIGERDAKESRTQIGGLVFVFSGQGPQWHGMGRLLLSREPVYREVIERCDAELRAYADWSLLDELKRDENASRLNQTEIAQPALFALQMGLAALWDSWGISPDAIVGHSIGEVAAACFSGILTLEDAIKVVYHRGRLLQRITGHGRMAAVNLAPEDAERIITDYQGRLSIGAVNSPTSITLTGAEDALDHVLKRLSRKNIFCKQLPVDYAFHSPQTEVLQQEMIDSAAGIKTRSASIDVLSTVTGRPAGGTDFGAAYWAENIRRPVQFARAVDGLITGGHSDFLEIGPHPVLALSISQCLASRNTMGKILPSLRRGQNDRMTLIETLADLYMRGRDLRWRNIYPDRGRCVQLPVYPWRKKSYWLELSSRKVPTAAMEKPLSCEEGPQTVLMDLRWLPRLNYLSDLPRTSTAVHVLPGEIASTLGKQIHESRKDPEHASFEDAARYLEKLSAFYAEKALWELDPDFQPGDAFTEADLAERTGVIDKYRRLLGRMLEMIRLEGGLNKAGSEWTIGRPFRNQELVFLQSEMVRLYPGLTHECEILQNCANILVDTLTGKCNPLEVLFPQGELSSLERLYEDAMMTMLPNRLLRSAFNIIMEQLPQDRTLRILELGAGTGGTTAHIVKDLSTDRIDYVYTDISNHFLDKAKEKFRKYPFLRYELLNIEQDPERLGFSPHQFDVVFASNVLHATVDLTHSVGNALSLLASGGLMFLIEGVRPTGWIDLIFGQLDGWWRFADTDLRPSYPLLSIDKWKQLLEQLGCTAAAAAATADSPAGEIFEQAVIVAKAPAVKAQVEKENELPGNTPKTTQVSILFGDRRGVAASLSKSLRDRGQRCLLVDRADQFKQTGPDGWTMNPSESADYERLVDEVLQVQGLVVDRWMYFWSTDEPETAMDKSEARLENMVSDHCARIIYLLQAIAKSAPTAKGRLYLLTRGAQYVAQGSMPPDLAQSPLWGLGRTAANEYPDFWGGLIDLDPMGDPDATAELLIDRLRYADDENQIVLRGMDRFVPRLLPVESEALPPATLKPDGSYMITGGLGDLGIETAKWLAEQGAKKLILLGRTPLTDRTQWENLAPDDPDYGAVTAIIGMEQAGTEIKTVSMDVTDLYRIGEFIRSIQQGNWGPVRGIVHAAARFEQRLLQHHNPQSFREDMRAKMMGAWHLHNELKNHPLDFFIFYSSLNSFLGLVGLSSYAASNAFLDALACYRKTEGLPALSLNWGPWTGLGFIRKTVKNRAADSLFAEGFEGIRPEQAFDALGFLMQKEYAQAGIAQIDGAKLEKTTIAQSGTRVFANLSLPQRAKNEKPEETEKKTDKDSLRETIAGMDTITAQIDYLNGVLKGMLSDILKMEAAEIHSETPVGEFGLDSLMAVEFKNRCEKAFDLTLPATMAWNHPTVTALSNHLCEMIRLSFPETESKAAIVPPEPQKENEAAARRLRRRSLEEINQLSEEEVLLKLLGN